MVAELARWISSDLVSQDATWVALPSLLRLPFFYQLCLFTRAPQTESYILPLLVHCPCNCPSPRQSAELLSMLKITGGHSARMRVFLCIFSYLVSLLLLVSFVRHYRSRGGTNIHGFAYMARNHRKVKWRMDRNTVQKGDRNSFVVCQCPEVFPRVEKIGKTHCIFYINPLFRCR